MENLNDLNEKPEIDYPCDWVYKIIGRTAQDIEKAVDDVFHTRQYKLAESHQSKKGNYLSFTLTVEVDAQDDRDGIYYALKQHPNIVMVL